MSEPGDERRRCEAEARVSAHLPSREIDAAARHSAPIPRALRSPRCGGSPGNVQAKARAHIPASIYSAAHRARSLSRGLDSVSVVSGLRHLPLGRVSVAPERKRATRLGRPPRKPLIALITLARAHLSEGSIGAAEATIRNRREPARHPGRLACPWILLAIVVSIAVSGRLTGAEDSALGGRWQHISRTDLLGRRTNAPSQVRRANFQRRSTSSAAPHAASQRPFHQPVPMARRVLARERQRPHRPRQLLGVEGRRV